MVVVGSEHATGLDERDRMRDRIPDDRALDGADIVANQRDIRRLQVIQHLTRERGVNLAGVRHILGLMEIMHKSNLAPHPDLKQAYQMYSEIL